MKATSLAVLLLKVFATHQEFASAVIAKRSRVFDGLTGATFRARNTYSRANIHRSLKEVHSVASCANVSYGTLGADQELIDIFDSYEGPRYVSPPNHKGQTLVDMGLHILEVTSIDEKTDTFAIEGFLDLIWCDPRLSYNASGIETGEEFFLEEDAHMAINRIWWPDITFVNAAHSTDIENEELEIFPDGTVEYEERFGGILNTMYDIRQFPFDEQNLLVEIESFAWSEEYLTFHAMEEKIGFSTKFEIAHWHTTGVTTHLEHVQEIRDRAPFCEFVMEIYVERHPGFYVWKVMLPAAILVVVSFTVFLMKVENLADRMSVSLCVMLAVIAFQLIISQDLPRAFYFTFVDFFLLFSFVVIALTILENVSVNLLYRYGKSDQAVSVDHTCRWAFPLAYILGMLIGSLSFLQDSTTQGIYALLLLVMPVAFFVAVYCRDRQRWFPVVASFIAKCWCDKRCCSHGSRTVPPHSNTMPVESAHSSTVTRSVDEDVSADDV